MRRAEGAGFGGEGSGGGGGAEVGLYLTGDSCSRKARSSGSRLRRGSAVAEVEEGSGLELENQPMAASWRWNLSRQRIGSSCSMTFPISCGTRSGVPGAKDAKPHVQDQSTLRYLMEEYLVLKVYNPAPSALLLSQDGADLRRYCIEHNDGTASRTL